MYLEMKKLENNYVIFGSARNVIDPKKSIRQGKTMSSNLYFVLLNKDGELISEKLMETQGLDVPYSSVVLSDKKILSIFATDEKNGAMKILETTIID
jgi:hypothetical protein